MTTSVVQYAPVFLPGEPHPPTPPYREAWQGTAYRVTKSQTLLKQLCVHRCKVFACGSSAPVRVEHEGGAAPWLADPGDTKCLGTRTASTIGVMTLSESFFERLVAGDQKASLASLSP